MKIGIESLHFDRRKFLDPNRDTAGIAAFCRTLGVDRLDLHPHSLPGRLQPDSIKRIDDAFRSQGITLTQTASGFAGMDVRDTASCRAALKRA